MNMAQMAHAESYTSPEEYAYAAWLRVVKSLSGLEIDEDAAWDLFSDGCSPADAATKLLL